jgi:hypothetical protein
MIREDNGGRIDYWIDVFLSSEGFEGFLEGRTLDWRKAGAASLWSDSITEQWYNEVLRMEEDHPPEEGSEMWEAGFEECVGAAMNQKGLVGDMVVLDNNGLLGERGETEAIFAALILLEMERRR